MMNLCKFLMLSAVCATPLLAMDKLQVAERSELPKGNTSHLSPCPSTSHHVASNREELLEKLKYIGPILQSRIDYNNQVLPLLKEIKNLEQDKASKEANIRESQEPLKTARERIKKKNKKNELQSLQGEISEKLTKLHEMTDHDFNPSQLDCFLYFKETDQKANLVAQQLYEQIKGPCEDGAFFCAINNLYAYLSVNTHLNKAKTMTREEYLFAQQNGGSITRDGQTFSFAGSAKKTGDSQKEFKDRAYHKMILELLSHYCSEEAKAFHSFFARQMDGGISIGADTYKCKKIFKATLDVAHDIEEQGNDEIRTLLRERTLILLDRIVDIQTKGREPFNSSSEVIERIFSGDRPHQMLVEHDLFKACYALSSARFLTLKSLCDQAGSELAHLLQEYDRDLGAIRCTQKPAFLSTCLDILAQPDFDSIIDDDSDDGLSIEEKLSKLFVEVEESDAMEAAESAEEEVATMHTKKKGNKKKGKKKKAKSIEVTTHAKLSIADHSDEEHGSSPEDESVSAVDAQGQPEGVMKGALKILYLPSKSNSVSAADEITSSDRLNEGKKDAQPILMAKIYKQKKGIEPAKKELDPWVEELLTAREYVFKDTIKSVYYGLAGMGLKPEFMTRNEKFVLGFMSPLTGQPFAITEDVPHGAQLRKGQAAGWIKKIKYSLREHGIIPTGY